MCILILTLVSCVSNKKNCKTPLWKSKSNSFYKKEQKHASIKYQLHRKVEKKKHKCRK
jgi:hypothetical protein